MTFDYRIIKKLNGEYIVGEIYYDKNDNITYWCDEPVECWGETLELLKEEMSYINQAFEKPILIENKDKTLSEI